MASMHLAGYCLLTLVAVVACYGRRRFGDWPRSIAENEVHYDGRAAKICEYPSVPCPTCIDDPNSDLMEPNCHQGIKTCYYGIYRNNNCSGQYDCFGGPGDFCTEHMKYDRFDKRCATTFTCWNKRCQGPVDVMNPRNRTLRNEISDLINMLEQKKVDSVPEEY